MNVPKKFCKNCFSFLSANGKPCPVCGYVKGDSDETVLPRGTKLAKRYVIGGTIGHGGFGITYLAYDTTNGNTVAIKEYFPSAIAKRGNNLHVVPTGKRNASKFNSGAEKFFDEAELVRRFNGNPNIVSIYECFYENNTAYYVMEYIDGITLENYVKNYGVLNSAQALYIADKLTMALVVVHSGEVLHRDISPDNVMLCRDGKVKLIDFGAARQFLAAGSAGYTVIMKTGFSPMEQYSHNAESDTRTDIYSLGVLLYYALTGKVPENPYNRMKDDSAFGENASKADKGLWSVISKAAAVDPPERYQNAEEFRSALSELKTEMAAIAAPNDYNFLRTEDFASPNAASGRSKPRLAPIIAVVCAAAAILLVVLGVRRFSKPGTAHEPVELVLDSEYAGDFEIGGKIPSSRLKEFNSGVEITLSVVEKEDKEPYDVRGIIPVDSGDNSMLKYLTAPGELWADDNGYIEVENDTVSFVISREGIESLGDGELGFSAYNLIISSAVLKPSEELNKLEIYDFHKDFNAPYTVHDDLNGKTVTMELGEYRPSDFPRFDSQGIPKSAFYEFDGDVKVTVTLEDPEGIDKNDRSLCVYNAGYCYNLIVKYIQVPQETDGGDKPVSVDEWGIHFDPSRGQLIIIIQKDVKDKMSSGIFFRGWNVRADKVKLEEYNGDYAIFL